MVVDVSQQFEGVVYSNRRRILDSSQHTKYQGTIKAADFFRWTYTTSDMKHGQEKFHSAMSAAITHARS